MSYKELAASVCLAVITMHIPCTYMCLYVHILQVVLDLVRPQAVMDRLVNVLRPGSIMAAYLPKLAPGNKYISQVRYSVSSRRVSLCPH